jgi:hypothetical protein
MTIGEISRLTSVRASTIGVDIAKGSVTITLKSETWRLPLTISVRGAAVRPEFTIGRIGYTVANVATAKKLTIGRL